MDEFSFKEVQRFRTWWPWAALCALNILFVYAIIQQVVIGKPFGSEPASNAVLFLLQAGSLILLGFLYSIKLTTRYSNRGIEYQYYPFQLRATFIEWSEVSEAYMREYNSFYEYGGYGIRVGSKRTGKAINTSASCKKGLQLELKDGSLLLVGTKNPDAIQQIIERMVAFGKIRWGQ